MTRSKFLHREGRLWNLPPLPLPCLSFPSLFTPATPTPTPCLQDSADRPLRLERASTLPNFPPQSSDLTESIRLLNIVSSREPVTQGGEKGSKETSSFDEMVGDFGHSSRDGAIWAVKSRNTGWVGVSSRKQRLTIHSPTAVPLSSTVPRHSLFLLNNYLYHAGHFLDSILFNFVTMCWILIFVPTLAEEDIRYQPRILRPIKAENGTALSGGGPALLHIRPRGLPPTSWASVQPGGF